MNSGTQTHNISGQAHPVSISIQPGFALLDKADSSSQPRSKASRFHHIPCFCSEATCAFWDFTLSLVSLDFYGEMFLSFHIGDYLHGILFCKTKNPPKNKLNDTHSIRPSSTLFIRISVYLSEQLCLTAHWSSCFWCLLVYHIPDLMERGI